ncbi:MAG: hypothetical protein KBA64_16750 [Armatimonadetes bacterium]|nr:hypothetical protein [Armatimonadota bacterium]
MGTATHRIPSVAGLPGRIALGQDYVERLLTPPGANAWRKNREIACEVAAARRAASAERQP